MARITVEDCLRAENNRFALVQLAAKRTKQLLHGSKIVIDDPRGNKAVVMSLREIASGKVRFMTEEELRVVEAKEAEEAKLLAEREAAAVSSDISIADLLFAQATSLKEEAALAADDDDETSDDLDSEDGEIDDSDDDALDAADEIEDDSDEDEKEGNGEDEDVKPEPSDDF